MSLRTLKCLYSTKFWPPSSLDLIQNQYSQNTFQSKVFNFFFSVFVFFSDFTKIIESHGVLVSKLNFTRILHFGPSLLPRESKSSNQKKNERKLLYGFINLKSFTTRHNFFFLWWFKLRNKFNRRKKICVYKSFQFEFFKKYFFFERLPKNKLLTIKKIEIYNVPVSLSNNNGYNK